MNEDIALVISKIEIDRILGKVPKKEHLEELFLLEKKGMGVQEELSMAKNPATLERYLEYLKCQSENFVSLQKVIHERARVIVREALPEDEKVTQNKLFEDACQEAWVCNFLKDHEHFFDPLDQVMRSTAKKYFESGCDQFGRSGYDHIDSPVGAIMQIVKEGIAQSLRRSCK